MCCDLTNEKGGWHGDWWTSLVVFVDNGGRTRLANFRNRFLYE